MWIEILLPRLLHPCVRVEVTRRLHKSVTDRIPSNAVLSLKLTKSQMNICGEEKDQPAEEYPLSWFKVAKCFLRMI